MEKRDAYYARGASSIDTGIVVNSLFKECSSGHGVPLSSLGHLIAHQRLFSSEVHHLSLLEIFRQQTGQRRSEDLEMALLDAKQLRQALQALAVACYGSNYGLKADPMERTMSPEPSMNGDEWRSTASNRPTVGMDALYKVQALQEMLREVNLRNVDQPFKLRAASRRRGAFLRPQLLQTAYQFQSALRQLFKVYESESEAGPRAVNGRSLFRLATALHLVPDQLSAQAFHDLVEELYPGPQERRYFEERRMLQEGEEPDASWLQPVSDENGEPRFSFPELLEIIVLALLEGAPGTDALERLHSGFDLLQIPAGEVPFNASEHLQVVSGFLEDPNDREPSNLLEIWGVLDAELPALAPKKDPHLPQPTQVEKLPLQPLSAEQRIDEQRRKNPLGFGPAPKKGKKKKTVVKTTKWRQYFYGNVPVRWDEVTWLGKRPEPPEPLVPPVWQTDSKTAELQKLDDHIREEREECLAAPNGRELRLELIDEPLKAPKGSEEVSTLIQTALTFRRLKHYDQAMALLIRARKLWAMQVTGSRSDGPETRMQTPSPWSEPQSARKPAKAETQEVKGGGLKSSALRTGQERGRSPVSSHRRYKPKRDFESAVGLEEVEHLPLEVALFFFCELSSLHSALHEDELAGLLLWRALRCSQRLPGRGLDTAMVWSGLGRVAFHSGSHEAAARLYMRARSIRERLLGGDTIDTATCYNNLACCFCGLQRPTEALAFMELAVEILKALAGEDHPRTVTAIRNLAKVRMAPKGVAPEVPHLYSLPVHDFTRALRGGKKKKKKGRSKSGSSRKGKK